nr:peptide chain release factor N(5)-glutamine methyltransferase [Sporobacter termitidis]
MNTYNDIFLTARKKLRDADIEAYDMESRLIVITASGKTKEQFMRDRHLYVTEVGFENDVEAMVRRRVAGEPIAYILSEWEFYGMPLTVSRDVLIPRVDTEVLVDVVVALYKDNLNGTRVLDMCAGSGCIGLAIAANVPFCRVLLADKSQEALKICRANTIRNNLTRSVTSIELDALEGPPMLMGLFDLIVCNPPYIPTGDIPGLDVSVRDFEPREALDGGEDGLQFYRGVSSKWKSVLKDDGRIVFECGVGQAEGVRAILEENGFTDIATYKDSLNIDRVVTGILNN